MEKVAIISIIVRVKEVSPSNIDKTRKLFRDFLRETMANQSYDFAIPGVPIVPECVGITKIDRRTLFSGMAVKQADIKKLESLQSDLHEGIIDFLVREEMDTGLPRPITIDLHPTKNAVSEFVAAPEKAIDALRRGPQKSSQIAEATALDEQLNNILLCMLEEQGLVRREETDELDDIFVLTQ